MPLVPRPNLARAFSTARLATGLSLRDFCRKHHLDPSRYARLESGHWTPSRLATLEKYALAIGVQPGSRDGQILQCAWMIDRFRQNPAHRGKTLQAVVAELRRLSHSPPSEADLLVSLLKRTGKVPGGPSELPPLKRVSP